MSYIINKLGLGCAPVTLERLGNVNVAMWRGRCDCDWTCKPCPTIGLVLGEMSDHAGIHRVLRQEQVA